MSISFALTAVSSLMSVTAGPLLVLAFVVLVVTVIALCRAEKQDVPKIFASFAQAFGFHKATEGQGDRPETEPTSIEEETGRPEEAA
ncbi:hypothetical protein IU483_35255 [Streptomyces gardneri]|nr:hypothetical protein [Streptomyces gardneri]